MTKKRRPQVGIRELKARASEIVGEVRERQTIYTVTHRGQPVAVLSPLPAPEITSVAAGTGNWSAFLTALDRAGQDWRSEKSGLEILADVRR